jgi:hypothetical protein
MPKWSDERERLKKLLAAPIPPDEPCTRMRFPRRDAAKRAKNTEGRKRIVFPSDPVTYAQFHAEKERITRQLGDNPVLFGVFVTDMLKAFSEPLVAQWLAIHEGPENVEQAESSFDRETHNAE